jgi:hypothetical protein
VIIRLFYAHQDRSLHWQKLMVITTRIRWIQTTASLVPSQDFPTGMHHINHRKPAVGNAPVEGQNGDAF